MTIIIVIKNISTNLLARRNTPTHRAPQLRTKPESLYGGEGLRRAVYTDQHVPFAVLIVGSNMGSFVAKTLVAPACAPAIASSIGSIASPPQPSSSPRRTHISHIQSLCISVVHPPYIVIEVVVVSRYWLSELQYVFHQLFS